MREIALLFLCFFLCSIQNALANSVTLILCGIALGQSSQACHIHKACLIVYTVVAFTTKEGQAMSRWQRDLLPYFPPSIAPIIAAIPEQNAEHIEELRFRVDRPMMALGGEEWFLGNGGVVPLGKARAFTVMEARDMLERLTEKSLYAHESELRRGYITLPGGYRVGLAGRAGDDVKSMGPWNAFNVRIARSCPGSADSVLPYILHECNCYHTLIISPPQMGKTTMLRDIARQLGDGVGSQAWKVCVVDERSEIAGCYRGVPQRPVGMRTDVLDGCPKAIGMLTAMRALSPQVVVTDEIGRAEDASAIEECLHSGVSVITSAHGNTLEELEKRPHLQRLMQRQVFERFILLGGRPGRVLAIYNQQRQRLSRETRV